MTRYNPKAERTNFTKDDPDHLKVKEAVENHRDSWRTAVDMNPMFPGIVA